MHISLQDLPGLFLCSLVFDIPEQALETRVDVDGGRKTATLVYKSQFARIAGMAALVLPPAVGATYIAFIRLGKVS